MRISLLVACAFALIAACGGSVEKAQLVDKCEPGSACNADFVCKRNACNPSNTTTFDQTCTCEDGRLSCPGISCARPDFCPSNGVSPGTACAAEGAQCYSNEPLLCTDIPAPCKCTSGKWQCNKITCPSCPPVSAVKHGAKCSETRFNCPGTIDCGSLVMTKCNCFAGGTWQCAPIPDCDGGG